MPNRVSLVRTGSSPPVALHPASRRRSYLWFSTSERLVGRDSHPPLQVRSRAHWAGPSQALPHAEVPGYASRAMNREVEPHPVQPELHASSPVSRESRTHPGSGRRNARSTLWAGPSQALPHSEGGTERSSADRSSLASWRSLAASSIELEEWDSASSLPSWSSWSS